MNIGEAARTSGVSAKMIRYYESVVLTSRPTRTKAGYRTYDMQDVHILRFIKRARGMGFSMKRVATLLALWKDKNRNSSEVKRLAKSHIAELEVQIKELQAVVNTLHSLSKNCHGNNRPECPILDDLSDEH